MQNTPNPIPNSPTQLTQHPHKLIAGFPNVPCLNYSNDCHLGAAVRSIARNHGPTNIRLDWPRHQRVKNGNAKNSYEFTKFLGTSVRGQCPSPCGNLWRLTRQIRRPDPVSWPNCFQQIPLHLFFRYFKLVAPDLLELRAPRVNLLFLGDYVDVRFQTITPNLKFKNFSAEILDWKSLSCWLASNFSSRHESPFFEATTNVLT